MKKNAAVTEKLTVLIRVYVTPSMRERIEAETKPGRNMSDVARDALEAYFAAKDAASPPKEPTA